MYTHRGAVVNQVNYALQLKSAYWYLLFYKHIDNFLYSMILIILKNYEFYNIL